ncbi:MULTISPECIES: aminotransferase class I/II-fold pyridoxal phosphate-dependent enzyme [unclassified Lentimonas]|uniref:aminotransferase class I/II-fold pyridoxal phosphate-dependent enzyme n=1 Tax=unclassified Lentimonas TaxID=2630993 RepID=UPI0013231C4A|nr:MULTISPECIES: aminotransferase class I/II-fold pyridoxal phosphate-dependent enzyme [unclassified Lentimonas]CAA6678224.1 8-amino-7-oxononanoate synthase (EC [Lentimonas sp. CC4]CAA6684880.1 8-amino-7-oxononanoate synthase (EC [Lentimonas sp. CC6]CAA7076765.1 8-amino-7-oxononanoate synthase (EC [Lentimonas sp. CC4]CAA7170837.1 8-amino-7-oxononanoate synthase (EC [Lentimonas sp. CC21]CAA7179600.1 8-amino-7-oxononanoate synthase (EC [Lentimonas sp. CC8]
MQTFFITANDTDVGKTYITGLLARHFSASGLTVQIVKAIDCGGSGDADCACNFADAENVTAHTLMSYPAPLAPMAEANAATSLPTVAGLINALAELPEADVRLIEGAGGVAVPIDPSGLDWRDFIDAYLPDLTIAVVDNRLGSINQSRLLHSYLQGRPHAFILNAVTPPDPAVNASNLDAYNKHELTLLGCVHSGAHVFELLAPDLLRIVTKSELAPAEVQNPRIAKLEARKANHVFRETKVRHHDERSLNLSDNDTLGLRHHPALVEAAYLAVAKWGTSSSASPLISGYTAAHADLEATLSNWYDQRAALVWNSGYAANQALLKHFVDSEDLILADRLIHHSLISGALQSGARIIRFRHNDLSHLESLLKQHHGTRKIHLVTESVYSMDGDAPDLKQIAYLKSKYTFKWILDEAHAIGWYGETGSGLAEADGVLDEVDILVGTFGKALAASGAYTIFKDAWMRDYCVNEAGEFIYSTYLPPSSAATAQAAIELIQQHPEWRTQGQAAARDLRARLRGFGWEVLGTDSAVLPVLCGTSKNALEMAARLLEAGIRVGAIRPPTVPLGQARLRISLKSTLTEQDTSLLVACFEHGNTDNV